MKITHDITPILDEIESRKNQTYDGEAHIISNEKLDALIAAARERDELRITLQVMADDDFWLIDAALYESLDDMRDKIRAHVEQALSSTAPSQHRDMEKDTQFAIGEDFSLRFSDYLARQQISDEDWERELLIAASKAFDWAFDAHRESRAVEALTPKEADDG